MEDYEVEPEEEKKSRDKVINFWYGRDIRIPKERKQ